MLRPTLKELLTGLQGTVLQTLIPELTSPYAQGQAMSVVKGWLRRHLARQGEFLGNNVPS
jgi:hypothetical protein